MLSLVFSGCMLLYGVNILCVIMFLNSGLFGVTVVSCGLFVATVVGFTGVILRCPVFNKSFVPLMSLNNAKRPGLDISFFKCGYLLF